jgi:hypothetical protein
VISLHTMPGSAKILKTEILTGYVCLSTAACGILKDPNSLALTSHGAAEEANK